MCGVTSSVHSVTLHVESQNHSTLDWQGLFKVTAGPLPLRCSPSLQGSAWTCYTVFSVSGRWLSSRSDGPSPTAFEPVAQHTFKILCTAQLCCYHNNPRTFLKRVLWHPRCSMPRSCSSLSQGLGWQGCQGRAGLLPDTAPASQSAAQATECEAPGAKCVRRDMQILSAPHLPKSGGCLGFMLASPCIAGALKGPWGPSGLMKVLPT